MNKDFFVSRQEKVDVANQEAFVEMDEEQKKKRKAVDEALKILTDNGVFGMIFANVPVDKDRELPLQVNNVLTLTQFNDTKKVTWGSYRQQQMLNDGVIYGSQCMILDSLSMAQEELTPVNIWNRIACSCQLMLKWWQKKGGDTPQEIKDGYQSYLNKP